MIFSRKTVESIAAHFHKMVSDLEDVMKEAEEQATFHEQVANAAIRQRLVHLEESAKANKLCAKIKELLS